MSNAQQDPKPELEPEALIDLPGGAWLIAQGRNHKLAARIIAFLLYQDFHQDIIYALIAHALPHNETVSFVSSDGEERDVGKVLPCELAPHVFARVQLDPNVIPESPPLRGNQLDRRRFVSEDLWLSGTNQTQDDDKVPLAFAYLSALDVNVELNTPDSTRLTANGLHIARYFPDRIVVSSPDKLIGLLAVDVDGNTVGAIIAVNPEDEICILAELPNFDAMNCKTSIMGQNEMDELRLLRTNELEPLAPYATINLASDEDLDDD